MQCPLQNGSPEVLLDYCTRVPSSESLDLLQQQKLEQHIHDCVDCKQFVAAQEAVWTGLDDWKPEPISSDFDQRLYARIGAEGRQRFWPRIFGQNHGWRAGVPMAGAFAAAALAVVMIMPGQKKAMAPAAETRVESLEPEQFEQALEDLDMLKQLSVPPTVGANQQAL
ncbi:MAG: hypothetical protein H7Y20_09480 [Bryobacteraceae bacterium]|nr:hypothetical protein [Bryobacteraceae bacterium]